MQREKEKKTPTAQRRGEREGERNIREQKNSGRKQSTTFPANSWRYLPDLIESQR